MIELQREPAKQLAKKLASIPAVKDILKEWMKAGKFPTVRNIDAKWISDRLKSKELMQCELLSVLDVAKANLPPERYLQLVHPYVEAMNAIHGEKIDVNINQNVMINDIKNFFGQEPKIINAEVINDNKKC